MGEESKALPVDKVFAENVDAIKISILEHLDRIANFLGNDELLQEYNKKDGKINWKTMREIMRKELSAELKEEWERMWEEEGLNDKLILLQTLSKNTPANSKAWRPKTGDTKPQQLALEKKKLLNEIEQLKKIHKEKKETVHSLKIRLTEDYKDISELRKRLSQHQASMDVIQETITQEIDNHYQSEEFSLDSMQEFQKDFQNTTLQYFVDTFL